MHAKNTWSRDDKRAPTITQDAAFTLSLREECHRRDVALLFQCVERWRTVSRKRRRSTSPPTSRATDCDNTRRPRRHALDKTGRTGGAGTCRCSGARKAGTKRDWRKLDEDIEIPVGSSAAVSTGYSVVERHTAVDFATRRLRRSRARRRRSIFLARDGITGAWREEKRVEREKGRKEERNTTRSVAN